MSIAPIALFIYNRPQHTQKTVEALVKNPLSAESDFFVFSDGPPSTSSGQIKEKEIRNKIYEIREYLKTITGFKSITIIEREKNMGLANSIISGVTEIVNKYGKVIVMEDDIVTSPHFLEYMNEALNLYENDKKVASISGYMYPVSGNLPETFFLGLTSSWGWATWKRAWNIFEPDGQKLLKDIAEAGGTKKFNIDGSYGYTAMLKRQIAELNNSWAIRWYASAYLNNMLTLYPNQSLVSNIGFDGSGMHSSISNAYNIVLDEKKINLETIPTFENNQARKLLKNYFNSRKPTIIQRVIGKITRILKHE